MEQLPRRLPAWVAILPQGQATQQMAAYRLAHREPPSRAIAASRLLTKVLPLPASRAYCWCTGTARWLCIRQYQVEGVLAYEIIEYTIILCDFTRQPPASIVTPVSTASLGV